MGDVSTDLLSAAEREEIRKKVNAIVAHQSDPAKRARLVKTLTKSLITLAMIDAIDRAAAEQ